MHSSMIGKIAKAKQYAQEPERIQMTRFEAAFRGENDTHTTTFDSGKWHCTCRFFADWGTCCHTMAIERVLGVTIPATYRQGAPIGTFGVSTFAHR
ncbi:MAG TPA: hypothetical protein VIC85_18060 [Ktedonobacterales bacterium]